VEAFPLHHAVHPVKPLDAKAAATWISSLMNLDLTPFLDPKEYFRPRSLEWFAVRCYDKMKETGQRLSDADLVKLFYATQIDFMKGAVDRFEDS
jgi:hypothetical protein